MSRGNRTQRGFTLLELMVAITILGVVVAGVFESLSRQQKTSIVTESIVEVQNNLRAVSNLVEREIRMAGFMIPDAVGVCAVDRTAGSDTLYVSETEPIVPDDERAGTLGARLSAASGAWANPAGTVTVNLDSTTTDLDGDGAFFYDNDGNGTPEADFRVNGGFILADAENPQRGVICGRVSAATSTQMTLVIETGHVLAARLATDPDEEIVIVPAARYAMDTSNPTAIATGRFMRNGDLLAQGIDDFQLSFFFDRDDDGVIDALPAGQEEEPGIAGGVVYTPSTFDNTTLKEVRFSLVVRTRANDPDYTNGSFVNMENRAAIAGNDGFRRRVIASRVRPRNIGATGSI